MKITARPAERVYAGQRPESSHTASSYPYVPGPVVLGGFAATWIREFGPPQQAGSTRRDEFISLFHGDVMWPALWAEGSVLVPLSVKVCKYGFKTADGDGCRTFAFDTTADLGPDAPPSPSRCPHCGGPLEHGKGQVLHVPMVGTTRVELEPMLGEEPTAAGRRERAKESQLFARRSIERGTTLVGESPTGVTGWLGDLAANGETVIWFGGKRSVGGRCATSIEANGAGPAVAPLGPRAGGGIVLTARTPSIFTDPSGLPRLDPDPKELDDAIGCPVKITCRWVRPTTVGGWHAHTGLPKPVEIATVPGSTWLLKPADPVSPEGLANLARLGLRTHEGFGSFAVNPPPFTLTSSDGDDDAAAHSPPAEPSSRERADEVVDVFGPDGLVDWVGDILRQRALDLASGRGGTLEELRSRANYARLRPRQRSLLETILASHTADTLADLAALMAASSTEDR